MIKLPGRIFLILFQIFSFTVFAQTPESILDSIGAGRKPEKVYVHFDKEIYSPGATIWYRSYVMVDGLPGIFSTAAKAELYNAKGDVISSQIIPITIGAGAGSLKIPVGLTAGVYLFRFYTQHMRQMGNDHHYYKPIYIGNPESFDFSAVAVEDVQLVFYPEGGNFLAGELNNLAFKVTDQLGRPVNIQGKILDNKSGSVVNFSTIVNGMGKVEIKPVAGENYRAVINLPSGKEKIIALPALKEEGTNMYINEGPQHKQVYIDSRFTATDKKPAYILATIEQTMVYRADISKYDGHYQGTIPTKDFPGGLLHIAVFSNSHEMLAERVCFINNQTNMAKARLETIKKDLGKRGLQSFGFSIPDSLEGSFSVAVAEDNKLGLANGANTMRTRMLITGDMEGKTEEPFIELKEDTGELSLLAVDLFLLTSDYKWRWSRLLELSKVPTPEFNEYYITMKGKATSSRTKLPLGGADLSFIIHTKDSAINYFSSTTDAAGNFNVQGMYYADTATIYVKNNTPRNRDKKVEIEMTSKPISTIYDLPLDKETLRSQMPLFAGVVRAIVQPGPHDFDFDTTAIVLREIVLNVKTANPTQLVENRYSSGIFGSQARSSIDFINNPVTYSGGNIFDYLKGRHSYMTVMGKYPNYMLVYRGMFRLGTGDFIPMGLFLDEMPVSASQLLMVPMREIALVRVYGPGITGQGGAVAIYRKKGEDSQGPGDNSLMKKLVVPGFSPVDNFFSPDYTTEKNLSIRSDKRSTLHWDPSLLFLPEAGSSTINFHQNDNEKSYRITIQGFTTDGKIVDISQVIR